MRKEIVITIMLLMCLKSAYSQYRLKDIPYTIDSVNRSNSLGRQGIWFFYYKTDSTIIEMQNFLNDTLEGYFERYWPNGRVSERGFYKKGLLDSLYIAYWENGNRRGEVFYKNGELNGVSTMYDQDEKIYLRLKYLDGKVDSAYENMFVNPNIIWDKKIEPKIDTVKAYFNTDWNKRFRIFSNDTLISEINFYRDQPLIEDTYIGGIISKRIVYNRKAPGNIKKIFYFKEGKLSITEIYNKRGKLIKRESVYIKNK